MSLKRNLIANYLGQGWSGLMGFAFVPLYLKYLGAESFGLIGVFLILQACLSLFDMAISPTINREMARYKVGAHDAQSIRNLLRSLEFICFGVVVLFGLSIWSLSGWLADSWFRVENLPGDVVSQALSIMGAVAGLRFFEGLYRATLLGLQKQVTFNLANAVLATLRSVGAAAILVWYAPTIKAYFVWQGLVSIASLMLLAAIAYRNLPVAGRPASFSMVALREVRSFAAGMLATAVLSLLLTQVDKVLLSRLLSLESFGYYSLAATVASAIALILTPITQTFFPRFSEQVALKRDKELIASYHRASQLVSIFVASPAMLLVLFSEEILRFWTGDNALSIKVAPLLSLLALGTLFNGLMTMPYMLQLAHGWSNFAARVNFVAVVFLVPAIFWIAPHYGAIGVAWVWVLLNAGYVLISIHFMHLRLLPTEKWRWYWQDLTLPVLVALGVMLTWKWVFPLVNDAHPLAGAIWLVGCGLTAFCAAAWAVTPELSAAIVRMFRWTS